MHKQTGYSISGVQYKAIDLGPVPNNYQSVYEYITNREDVEVYITEFEDGRIGEQFRPNINKQFNKELFSVKENAVLDQVASLFMNKSTKEIIELSHEEEAWLENEVGKKMIDYNYSFFLKNF